MRSGITRRATVVAVVTLVASCGGRVAPDPGPTPLFKGIMSRRPSAELRLAFQPSWEVLDDITRRAADGRGQVRLMRVMVDCDDLGVRGRAMLRFLDDRLTSITFFPSDPKAYQQAVKQRYGFSVASGETGRLPPGTEIVGGVNATGDAYVAWEDEVAVDDERRAET